MLLSFAKKIPLVRVGGNVSTCTWEVGGGTRAPDGRESAVVAPRSRRVGRHHTRHCLDVVEGDVLARSSGLLS